MFIVPPRGNRFGQQSSRRFGLSLIQQIAAGLQHFFAAPLPLAERGPRAVDVGSGAGVSAIEEEDPGPEMDGVFVAAAEVAIEAVNQQRLNLAVAIRDLVLLGWRRKAS